MGIQRKINSYKEKKEKVKLDILIKTKKYNSLMYGYSRMSAISVNVYLLS